MGHQNELAHHKILKRFAENEEMKGYLAGFREPEYPVGTRAMGIKIDRNEWKPRYVVAIDGSHHEEQYDGGFPGAELSFVSVATVGIDIHQLIETSSKATIDPVEFNKIQSASPLTEVFPSCNMVHGGMPDARASFRKRLHDVLGKTKPAESAESLLDTYEYLFSLKKTPFDQKCPLADICEQKDRPLPDFESGKCACGKYPVYKTDALRIQERFSDSKSNGESFGEVMRVLEHLFLVSFVRYMEQVCEDSDNWSMFADTAIVMDGSLAVFGNPAWLSQTIKTELSRLNSCVMEKTGKDMLILGIEKSGRFFDHWCRLDTKTKQDFEREREDFDMCVEECFGMYESGRIERQSVLLLDDPYIKKYVIPSDSKKVHGKDTYYGRPFLYKTKTGAMIAGISPIYSPEHEDRETARLSQFPRLAEMLDLLDLLVSMRYPNAIIPLVAAHAEAAIPMRMGEKVLDKIAREHVGQSKKQSPSL